MRIDLTTTSKPELDRSQGSQDTVRTGQAQPEGIARNANDVAELSTSSDAVAALRSYLDGVPDVRGQRVDSLRQMIAAGQFTVSPERIADGMLADGAFTG